MENIRLQNHKKSLQDIILKREKLLRDSNHDAHAAYTWYKEHGDIFTHEVVPPMILSLSVTDKSMVKQVEAHVNKRDLFAFTFTDKNDLSVFVDKVNTEMNNKTASLLAPSEEAVEKFKTPSPDLMKKLSLTCVLQDVIKAPRPVIRYLLGNNFINITPVGGPDLEHNMVAVSQSFRRFYSPDKVFICSTSKYSGNVQMREDVIPNPRLLVDTVDEEKLKEVNEKIAKNKDELELCKANLQCAKTHSEGIDSTINELHRERSQFNTMINRRTRLNTKMGMKQQTLHEKECASTDLKHQYQQLITAVTKTQKSRMELLTSVSTQVKSAIASNEKHVINMSKCSFHQKKNTKKHLKNH